MYTLNNYTKVNNSFRLKYHKQCKFSLSIKIIFSSFYINQWRFGGLAKYKLFYPNSNMYISYLVAVTVTYLWIARNIRRIKYLHMIWIDIWKFWHVYFFSFFTNLYHIFVCKIFPSWCITFNVPYVCHHFFIFYYTK